MSLTDQHYIQALKNNDPDVIGSLYTKHRISFLHFAKKYPMDQQQRLDIYQDAFIALREKAISGALDNLTASLKTYLFGIAKFLIYKALKQNQRTVLVDSNTNHVQTEPESIPVTLQSELTQNQLQLKEGFKKLGKKCKNMLTSFYFRGLTIEEIAQEDGYKNSDVVKSQKSRCLKQLKATIFSKV